MWSHTIPSFVTDVAVNSTDYIYTINSSDVVIYEPDGTQVDTFTHGLGATNPSLVTDSAGDVYVRDSFAVTIFGSSGNLKSSFGHSSTASGYGGVAVNSTGHIFIAGDSGLEIFDSSGTFIVRTLNFQGLFGGIAIDANDQIYLTNGGLFPYFENIYVVDPNGEFLYRFGTHH